MKVKELIALLEKVKDKDRDLQILIGNEDNDDTHYDQFELMHTLDDDEGVVEIFANTDTQYNITKEEAWVSLVHLTTEFTYKGKKYRAFGVYANNCGIDDIEVNHEDGSLVENDALGDKLYEIAKETFQEMDIEKHLTL